ncbi:glycoside hydrolase family 10 protein [Citricoccus sp. SGAir0253]|uniref:glycoside hydrolase family 10 protein n=1 Tax=Citricoccus sp. SGAir0253 TaxID=2567881 RepID=UPI00143D864D|nr:family 10 glycosylhydrolase [Citricoccus sp. SGAir0253]
MDTNPSRRAMLQGAAASVLAAAGTAVGAAAPALAALPGRPYPTTGRETTLSRPYPLHEFRGVWVATVLNIDWPSRPGLTIAEQQAELTYLCKLAGYRGYNAVLLQVRAAGDRLYRSSLGEPWSRYLTGTLGRDPGWDPLEWAIREAGRWGLQLHAWVNPFRVAMDTSLSSLYPGSYAARNPGHTYAYGGRRYLDPGLLAVRRYVRSVLAEIAGRYRVAGIHLDDYFYPYPVPGTPIPDGAAYAAYGGGLTLGDWRRENIRRFVRDAGPDIHALNPRAAFSISPFGIWRHLTSSPLGSATSGLQAYDDLYVDTRRWLKSQYADLFVPQLYWQLGHPTADYSVLARWWNEAARDTRTQLAFGEAVYKMGSAGWTDPNELRNHVTLTRSLSRMDGNGFYNASAMKANVLGGSSRVSSTHYTRRALPLRMPWLGSTGPEAPAFTRVTAGTAGVRLEWTVPAAGVPAAWLALWRRPAVSTDVPRLPSTAEHLALVRAGAPGAGTWTDATAVRGQRYWYILQSFSQNATGSVAGSAIMTTA